MSLGLTKTEVIVYSLSFSFFFVNEVMRVIRDLILKYYKRSCYKIKDFSRYNEIAPKILEKRKPFDCLGCMTAWITLLISSLNGLGYESFFLMFTGYLIGSLIDSIKMKWL